MEGSHEVLYAVVVNPSLSPYGGIHHSEKRGRDIHRTDTSHIGSGSEAPKIQERTASNQDKHRVPSSTFISEP